MTSQAQHSVTDFKKLARRPIWFYAPKHICWSPFSWWCFPLVSLSWLVQRMLTIWKRRLCLTCLRQMLVNTFVLSLKKPFAILGQQVLTFGFTWRLKISGENFFPPSSFCYQLGITGRRFWNEIQNTSLDIWQGFYCFCLFVCFFIWGVGYFHFLW